MTFSMDELAKFERALGDQPNWETVSGYTGNKRKNRIRKISKKQRKTDHLSNKGRRELFQLQKQVDNIFISNSHIKHKSEEKDTKKEHKKGENNNAGANGIHSNNTYKKYKSVCNTFVKYCYEHYSIGHLSEIKPRMYLDWLRELAENPNIAAKTVSTYVSAVRKMAEGAEKMGKTYERLTRLNEQSINKHVQHIKETYDVTYRKKDYKRGKNENGTLGYSYREAQKITKKAYNLSPYYGLLYDTFTHAGLRHEEALKTKWSQIDTENNRIYLTGDNHTKGNRARFVPIPSHLSEKFQALMESDLVQNPDTRIWGSRLTKNDVYALTKNFCREAHVGYGAVHDFRRAAVEYQTREIKRAVKSGSITRSDLQKHFIAHVSIDPKLNPIVVKKERERDENGNIVYLPVLDRNGNQRYHADGRPRRRAKWVPKKDAEGRTVRDRKYTPEEIAEWRMDKLINSVVSQFLGHNRTDVVGVYRNG